MTTEECDEIKQDIKNLEQLLMGMSRELQQVSKAFPRTSIGEIDADGHRHYHEAMIRAAQQQEKFWSDLRQELMKKGLTVVLILLVGLGVTGFGVEFKAFLAKVGAK